MKNQGFAKKKVEKLTPKKKMIRDAETWLLENEVDLFLQRTKIDDARARFNDGRERAIGKKLWRECLYSTCRIWKVTRLKRCSRSERGLTEKQWAKAMPLILKMIEIIGDRKLDILEFSYLMRTQCSVPWWCLNGLPERYQTWRKAK